MVPLLRHVATQLITSDGIEALYEQVLDTVMAILHSDFASIQMFYPERGTNGELRLLGYRGFNAQAAKRWEWVDASTRTTCGEVLRSGRRVDVADIRRCDFMAESEDLKGYLAEGIRAAQSTPLVSRSGALVGMVSTYWLEPHELSATELGALDILARQAADLIERSRAEGKLRRSEELLRSVQGLTHVGSWEWDLKTNQVSWSDEEYEIFGQPKDYKPTYEGFFEKFIPQDRHRVARELRNALAKKRGFSRRVQIIRPNGDLRTISLIAEMRFDKDGLPVGMFGSTQDVTDVEKNETKLLQSQKDLRALAARLVDLQESGMKELARELHDDLSQNLASLGIEISTLLRPLAKRSRAFSERARALQLRMKQIADDVHSISMRFHPAILHNLGLKAALQEECRRFSEQRDIRVRFNSEGESPLLAEDVSLCLYRVAQEGLNNIAKHAHATKVRLTLSNTRRGCKLRIEDDGQGFDPSGVKGKRALGLISLAERTRLVNGTFTIKSVLGKGTTLEVSVGSRRRKELHNNARSAGV